VIYVYECSLAGFYQKNEKRIEFISNRIDLILISLAVNMANSNY